MITQQGQNTTIWLAKKVDFNTKATGDFYKEIIQETLIKPTDCILSELGVLIVSTIFISNKYISL